MRRAAGVFAPASRIVAYILRTYATISCGVIALLLIALFSIAASGDGLARRGAAGTEHPTSHLQTGNAAARPLLHDGPRSGTDRSSHARRDRRPLAGTRHLRSGTRLAMVPRDSRGHIRRSHAARSAFLRQSGYPHGRPGYIVDHVVPLKRGGCDCPANMQWQTIAAAKAKDRWE